MIPKDATGLLQAERNLRFHDLRAGAEPGSVTLWVDGAEVLDSTTPAGTGNDDIDRILGPVHPVEVVPGSLRYTVRFHRCVLYAWRDDAYALPEHDEDFSRRLRLYERSAFLDFAARATFAADALTEPLQHFALVTLDAVLDVLCPDPPRITAIALEPDDPGPAPKRPRETGGPDR